LQGKGAIVSMLVVATGQNDYNHSVESRVDLYDVGFNTYTASLGPFSGLIRAVTFSPDGKTIATAGASILERGKGSPIINGQVVIWDSITYRPRFEIRGHSNRISSIAFSSDNSRLVTGSWDSTCRFWDLHNNIQLKSLSHRGIISAVAFSQNDEYVAAASMKDGTIQLWDAATFQEYACYEGHQSGTFTLGFSPRGTVLASGGADQRVRLWDYKTDQAIAVLEGHHGDIRSLSFSSDGAMLASSSWADHTIIVWDTTTWQPLLNNSDFPARIRSVCFSPDNQLLAIGTGEDDKIGEVFLLHIHTRLLTQFPLLQ
jgi:WD40 repeat protein